MRKSKHSPERETVDVSQTSGIDDLKNFRRRSESKLQRDFLIYFSSQLLVKSSKTS